MCPAAITSTHELMIIDHIVFLLVECQLRMCDGIHNWLIITVDLPYTFNWDTHHVQLVS
jgi:hypothetical protein